MVGSSAPLQEEEGPAMSEPREGKESMSEEEIGEVELVLEKEATRTIATLEYCTK